MVTGETGMIILYIIMGFFAFISIVCGITFFILWRRRKLVFTNFLTDTGQWIKQTWMPKDISDTFTYDGCVYKFDIKKCTRDKINRPIAHYYKNNPEQQIFNYAEKNKKIKIGNEELSQNDFITLMKTKVLKDIFTDDEVMMLLYILIGLTILIGVTGIIITITHKPPCVLTVGKNNETLDIIAQGVKLAIQRS